MNSLLRRQLQKYCGKDIGADPSLYPVEWRAFIDAVDKAYEQFDDDRKMLERSLDISSTELVEANEQMQAIFENDRERLEKKVKERARELLATNESLQREIAERLRVESALKKTEARFRMLVEQLPAIFYITEAPSDGCWRYVSPQIDAVLGFTPDQWLSDPGIFSRQLHPDDRDRVLTGRGDSLRSGTPFEGEYRIFSRDGRLVWCRDQASLVHGEETGRMFLQGVMLDITERKNLEDRLRHSLRLEAIGQLAGGIAHDFNNILTTMMGDSHLIRETIDKNHPAFRYVDGLLGSAQRAAALTQQLLAYSRRQTLQLQVVNLNDLLKNLESMLRRLIGEHIELQTSTPAAATLVKADLGQLEQVIINLVINARDAMPHGGTVSIKADFEIIDESTKTVHPGAPPGEYACVTVRDTGIGIPEHAMPHMFEPFFTTKAVGKGTGLGLATSYGIIKQSGGYISVESVLNQGTCFKIFLPKLNANDHLESAVRMRETTHLAGGNETILLAEDEEDVRSLAAEILRKLGYTVQEAANGEEALRIFEESPAGTFDLLLTDVIMPRMGGKELAEKLRSRQPAIEVIYMSGYAADHIDDRTLLAWGTGFLQKPFTPAMLAKKVREVLQLAKDRGSTST